MENNSLGEISSLTPAVRPIRMGIDVGSTTVKVVALGENDELLYGAYERHRADIRNTIITVVNKAFDSLEEILPAKENQTISVKVTGSGGLSVSQWLNIPFIQEVVAATTAVRKIIPQTDVVIELGGEDAKITYFKGGVEQRMNGTCAGGTGAFIDQMATLLNMSLEEMNEASLHYHKLYPIASRCGVFAKTDIQPLINQGVDKCDLCASIFQAVVDQTITSLAQGRKIDGNILFLGGPLYFLTGLRNRFKETLKLEDAQLKCPDTAIHFVALGTALCAETEYTYDQLHDILEKLIHTPAKLGESKPLFETEKDYQDFMTDFPIVVPIVPCLKGLPDFQQMSVESVIDFKIHEKVKDCIDSARLEIEQITGKNVQDRIFLSGYSASGLFAQRFALAYPEMINRALIGGAAGTIPVPTKKLKYPIGIQDYETVFGKEFDSITLKQIRQM